MEDFEWDDGNIGHLALHGVTPAETESALTDITVDIHYEVVGEEKRFTEVGMTKEGRFLAVVTISRRSRIRVVTAFDASPRMVHLYFRRKGNS